jgi:hypothetical protein
MNLSSDFGHWVPLQRVDAPNIQRAHDAIGMSNVEVWVNDVYEVFFHVYAPGQGHLSIKRRDRRPIRNWRHFQQMKNEVCGPRPRASSCTRPSRGWPTTRTSTTYG